MLKEFCGIKYKLAKSEGFDDFMKAVGVGLLLRKIICNVSSVIELSEDGEGTYTLKTSSTFKETKISFKLGEEADEVMPDGQTVRTTFTEEGDNKLVQVQRGEKVSTKVVREFSKEKVLATMTTGDVTATRIFEAVH